MAIREERGDDWARSELADHLRRLRQGDKHKAQGYRWLLTLRSTASDGSSSSAQDTAYSVTADDFQHFRCMLLDVCCRFIEQSSVQPAGPGGVLVHTGAVLEWALLWDVYLNYLGGGDRWLAYRAFADGLTVRGRRQDLWAPLSGEQIVTALEGATLTPDVVSANLKFEPNYGMDRYIASFRRAVQSFSAEELSMFLRFATGIGRLPASRADKIPEDKKLRIRFLADDTAEAHLRLPVAHTCINVMDVPRYMRDEDMALKLRQAIAAPLPFTLS